MMVICMQYLTITICGCVSGCGLFGHIGSNFLPMALTLVTEEELVFKAVGENYM